MRGEFRMRVYDKGQLVEEFTEPNLIVDAGFNTVQRVLSAASADYEITQIRFGELDGDEPTAPASDWTNIPAPILTKALSSSDFPTNRSVSFNWVLNSGEGNGSDICYFGLLSENDTLFAAKSRAPIAKTSDITLEGTWIIRY